MNKLKVAFLYAPMSMGVKDDGTPRHYDFTRLWEDPRGTTGSEISLLCFARELASRGHQVSLFTLGVNVPSWDGVTLQRWEDVPAFGPQNDVVYSWNEPDPLAMVGPAPLRMVNQQLNDWSYCRPGFPDLVDVFTSPSEPHRDHVCGQAGGPSKWAILPNGCYPEQYKPDAKVRGRVAYTSSPDRGLHLALQEWPHIKKAVPHAHLRIYYFSLHRWLRDCLPIENHWNVAVVEHARRARYVARALEKAAQLDIEVVGSVSRSRMVQELSEAEVLGYPCDTIAWSEGFSCATLEGCASGALPVIGGCDALQHIYGGAVPTVPPPARDHMQEWRDLVIRALTDKPWADEWRGKARTLAQEHSWQKLTDKLEGIIEQGFRVKFGGSVPNVMTPALAPPQPAAPAPAPAGAEEKQTHSLGVIPVHDGMRMRNAGVLGDAKGRELTIHFVLTEAAASGQTIDVRNPQNDRYGGGSRAGFLGLVRELALLKGYRVRAFSSFTEEVELNGAQYVPLARQQFFGKPDVLFAYFDTNPLAGQSGMLRIASHHSYRPYPEPGQIDWTDIHTAPTRAPMMHLQKTYDPWKPWYVLPNAVDELNVTRNVVPGRVIYHTAPSRGLHNLLKVWPDIKARVPHATLHIVGPVDEWCNGNYQSPELATSEQGRRVRWVRDYLAKAREAGGVALLNTLPRSTLLQELGAAEVFAYPCSVIYPCETFSISVMECCKMGLPVVLTPQDALAGIYHGAVSMVPSPPEENGEGFTEAVVQMLQDGALARHYAEKGKELASKYTFANAAKVLDDIIRKHV